MFNTIFASPKKLIFIASRDSARSRRLLKAKYDRLMRSRQVLLWSR